MNYTVLSPWAAVDTTQLCGLSPRLDTLAGKTIGMFADLFMVGVHMEEALAGELCRRYPGLKVKYIRYTVETKRIGERPRSFRPGSTPGPLAVTPFCAATGVSPPALCFWATTAPIWSAWASPQSSSPTPGWPEPPSGG